jgi:hypothetical protein
MVWLVRDTSTGKYLAYACGIARFATHEVAADACATVRKYGKYSVSWANLREPTPEPKVAPVCPKVPQMTRADRLYAIAYECVARLEKAGAKEVNISYQ